MPIPGALSFINRSRCIQICAASAAVLASAIARSKAVRALFTTAKLVKQRALHTEEVEIAGKAILERLDHGQRRFRPPDLGNGYSPVERDNE